MFTGIIQTLGTIKAQEGEKLRIFCSSKGADQILHDLAIGDSVAVDGICLTVEEILPQGFVAAVSPETLRRTTLEQRGFDEAGVNLETAVRVGSKLGGHIVSGHVDGIGCLESVEQTASSWEMVFTAPPQVARYIVPKGSIAINGVSLTVADCDPSGSWFKVAVIPHTYAETNLHALKVGGWVNLESDILGKYVEKLLRAGLGQDVVGSGNVAEASLEMISPGFLAEHGYL